MRQWLPAGHAAWLVIEAVRLVDTSAFHARRRTGGAGAAGYDPDMMVTLLVWAYANGITSSRRIERLCQQDVAFRVICAGNLPDHVTVARFRQQFAETAADLFAQVLLLCARLGMGQVGTIALDGTKIGADASKEANRTEEGLRKLAADLAARHAEQDAREDALFGDGRGDDDPGDPFTRAERVAAALASLEAERKAREEAEREVAEQRLEAARAGNPVTGHRPAVADVALAEAKVAAETAAYREKTRARQEAAAAAGRRPRGGPPVPPEEYCRVREARAGLERARARAAARAEAAPQDRKEKDGKKKEPARRNVTDPGSRLMPVRGGGFIQGYNAQNVTSEDGLLIATRLTWDTGDVRWWEQMMKDAAAAAAAMAAAGGPGGPVRLALADAGYLSGHNLTCPGPDRLIATGKRRDLEKAARTAADGDGGGDRGESAIAAMAARLATPEGIAAYRMRGHIAETPHGNIKHNLAVRRLSVRGIRKASGEWAFIAAVHNLTKAIAAGRLTPQALAGLAG